MQPVRDGEYTSTIYGMIRDAKMYDAIRLLQYELARQPTNRPALSLLGYCYYYTQDYANAAECYDQLSQLFPNSTEYKIYHAQSLFSANMFPEAIAVVSQVDDPKYLNDMIKLEAAIKYREDDIRNARILVEQYAEDDPDIEVNLACLEYKEGNYDKALERFYNASNVHGYKPQLAYAIALCHYRKKEFNQSLRFIAEIVDHGIKEHPELSVGAMTEGLEVRSVGNTLLLHETALIEALNLKFAIDYSVKNVAKAAEALTDMPPRGEDELDVVTLHNQALINVDHVMADGFAKLQFLLSQSPFPTEAFANLLLLYCKYDYIDLAADVLAENAHLTYKHLSPYLFEFLDATISLHASADEAYAKFDTLALNETQELRKLTQRIQDQKHAGNEELLRKSINDFDNSMERYLPVVMSQAKIFWDKQDYLKVEKLFANSVEFASEHPVFRLNVAHTLFMQEKFKEAAGFYEPIINSHYNRLLDVQAIVVANLCVCYIMTNQNDEAEQLMRKIEREEEEEVQSTDGKCFHLSIINLVIGTLYCSKGNYEFGISRVVKALEPYDRKLGVDTWFYSKRCLLSTMEVLAKRMLIIRDSAISDILNFLEQCEAHGKRISTVVDNMFGGNELPTQTRTVASEARLLRAVLLDVIDY